MGGYNLPVFCLMGTNLWTQKENGDLPPIWGDLPSPRDIIALHPYIMEDPRWWPDFEPYFDFSNPDTGLSMMMGPTSWNRMYLSYEETCGGSLPYKIMGIAKDAAGLPKAGCRALLYITDGDLKVSETITDTNGIYAFEVGNTTTQYYVVVMQSSPPLAGISVRTLTGV